MKKKKVSRKDLIEKYYKVSPIHKRRDLLEETIKLINSKFEKQTPKLKRLNQHRIIFVILGHWPKSRSERLSILGCSKDDLPMSLIVTFKTKERDFSDEARLVNDIFFNRQTANVPNQCPKTGKSNNVLGHVRLVPVPSDEKACFIESMVVHNEFRGKGIGSFLISEAEKFCEQVLHLKSIYLSTYDSGEFYMKIGFNLTSAICVFGNGETNTCTKKIFLKKDLNYVEPEIVEEVHEEVYDPSKDYNYKQQQLIEPDVVLSGFPFKMEQSKGIVMKLCQLIGFDPAVIRYFYSFEFLNRQTERRSFHMIISTASVENKLELLEKLGAFGVLCFQNFFEKPVNDYDNTLITHESRYTNLNFVIRKELEKMMEDKWIADFKYENYQFHAKQNDEWIIVRNMEVVAFLKTPLVQDVSDEEVVGWDDVEDADMVADNLEKLRQHFKTKASQEWWPSVRRPSEIKLEPLQKNEVSNKVKRKLFPWVSRLQSCHDAMTLGVSLEDF